MAILTDSGIDTVGAEIRNSIQKHAKVDAFMSLVGFSLLIFYCIITYEFLIIPKNYALNLYLIIYYF